MTYQTDSNGNYFVGSSLDDSGSNFVTDINTCLNAALGSSNYALGSLPTTSNASTPDNFGNTRIEWRPQGVGDSLTGTITLSSAAPASSGSRYFDNGLTLNSNARFGMYPYTCSQNDRINSIIRNSSGAQVNAGTTGLGMSVFSMGGTTRAYATITQNELIFYITNTNYNQFFLSYQGVVRSLSSTFSGSHPKGCVSLQMGNIFGTTASSGNSIWTDDTARALLMSSYTNACTVASGQTFGTNLWMTDFMCRFNASGNNNPYIGIPKNLKLAIGTSITPGNLYQPSTPIDGGSNLWLCAANYPNFTNGKIMLRVIT